MCLLVKIPELVRLRVSAHRLQNVKFAVFIPAILVYPFDSDQFFSISFCRSVHDPESAMSYDLVQSIEFHRLMKDFGVEVLNLVGILILLLLFLFQFQLV